MELPSEKSTTKLRLLRVNCAVVVTGKVGSGGKVEFGPVSLTMSNWAKLPGMFTSYEIYPNGIGAACAADKASPPASAKAAVVLCQEGARAPCCTRDEGGPFGAVL